MKSATRVASGFGGHVACLLAVAFLWSSSLGGCSAAPLEAQAEVCDQLERLSPAELERVFLAAKSGLEAQGIAFDSKIWADPNAYEQFMTELDKVTQCGAQVKPHYVQSALHSGEGPDNYCGPGHGHGTLLRPVSACLNTACFLHDSCYARCTDPTSLTCLWGGKTAPCDSAFFAAADGCDNTGARFNSWVILRLAHAFEGLGGVQLGCAPGMVCPRADELGRGQCVQSPAGAACKACLAKVDPECRERSEAATDPMHAGCSWSPVDGVCLSADCDGAHECYGLPAPPKPSAACPENTRQTTVFVSGACQAALERECCAELAACFSIVPPSGRDDCNKYSLCIPSCRFKSDGSTPETDDVKIGQCQDDCDLASIKSVQDAYSNIAACTVAHASSNAACQ